MIIPGLLHLLFVSSAILDLKTGSLVAILQCYYCSAIMVDSSASQSSASDSLLPSKPHQPLDFSKMIPCTEDSSLDKLSPSWFSQWPFLHYDEAQDLVLCHTCLLGFK